MKNSTFRSLLAAVVCLALSVAISFSANTKERSCFVLPGQMQAAFVEGSAIVALRDVPSWHPTVGLPAPKYPAPQNESVAPQVLNPHAFAAFRARSNC